MNALINWIGLFAINCCLASIGKLKMAISVITELSKTELFKLCCFFGSDICMHYYTIHQQHIV
ncbi:hypothetical protein AAW31_02005 [Nitrosomonas communis]|uniref:Uncharacterized protein n=1 Tax=Nitrosomonas communis TaxID=44574 RepID=A0A0F7KBB7_9PROT|nr:hypothetical protein AAW31_02005 [Nitrosomonas communis]